MKIERFPSGVWLMLALAVGFSTPLQAQDDDHGVINVRITKVKAGKVPEYLDLQHKLMESRKAAGEPGRGLWQVVRGPTNTFQSVSFHDNFAELDKPFNSGMEAAEWARWLSRIGDVIDSAQTVILRTHRDLAIPAAEGTVPKMLMLRYRQIGAGQSDEYHDWVRDKLVPALKEGGVEGVNFAQVVAGDDNNMWISASRVDNYAALDGPGPFAGKSERQIDGIMRDGNSMMLNSQNVLMRYRPDLSY